MDSMKMIKKNFGFGLMRLPMIGDDVDTKQVKKMVDLFISKGFNYFDTAHPYLNGKSELAVKECIADRYPRESFLLANKLSHFFFKSEEEIRPLFESQLKACGVEYFDFYLMHAQDSIRIEHFKKCNAYETAFKLKEEGKIRHVGFSFHDKAEVLDKLLTEYPQFEFVQIQFNYVDYEDDSVESRKCYEVCRKHNKPVVVMEPVKGGNLMRLPPKAMAEIDALKGGSAASYAIRFAAGFPGIMMVLSGMSTIDQMEENLSFMEDFKPLDEKEAAALGRIQQIIKDSRLVQCTACGYCLAGCPQQIKIPSLFADINLKTIYNSSSADRVYHGLHTKPGSRASDCIKCGKCEKACPQHLPIRELLVKVAEAFEVKKE